MTITLTQLKADNDGKLPAYAWPGGYPVYYVTSDGAALCPSCVNDVNNPVVLDDRDNGSGWGVEGYDINYEDADLYCDHCGNRIESAYAD